jgi:hypothetical protein
MALKDSRFGFSATDRSSNLSPNVSKQSQRLQIFRSNPTHDNGNDDKDGSSGDEDSNKDDSIEDEDKDHDDNNDDYDKDKDKDNGNNDDIYQDDIYMDDIYQSDKNGGDIGKWLPKSL